MVSEKKGHLPFLPGPEAADSSAVFQRKQSFQAFDTRFALRCSAENVPVIETHENEGRNELNKDEHRLRENLGHRSSDELWDHYHKACTEKEAKQFWAIRPGKKEEKKIVQFKQEVAA